MVKEQIKQAFVAGYKAGIPQSGMGKKAALSPLAQTLLAVGLHTVPGIVAANTSSSIQKDPKKYMRRGAGFTGGGLLAQGVGSALALRGAADFGRAISMTNTRPAGKHSTELMLLGLLLAGGGSLSTAYGTNTLTAGAVANRKKKNG